MDWFESNFVYRVDPAKRDFGDESKLKSYYFMNKGSMPAESDKEEDRPMGALVGRGLFAGEMNQVAHYLIPRDVPWVYIDSTNELYVSQDGLSKIQGYKPVVSAFDKKFFNALPSYGGLGEFFSEKPGSAKRQFIINNPMVVLQKRFKLKSVPDVQAFARELHGKGVKFSGEKIDFLKDL